MSATMRSARPGLDANHPPDTPIMLGGPQAAATTTTDNNAPLVSVEVQRELEWLTCGAFVARRGYRYADPIRSLVKPYTDNVVACKLANPFSIIGGLMAGVTAYQLPTDVTFWTSARQASFDEAQRLEAVTQARQRTLQSLGIKVPRPQE